MQQLRVNYYFIMVISYCLTFSFTPLHTAAAAGKAQAVEELLKRGADVTANNQNNQTPLFMAAESGNLSTIRAISGRLQLQGS